MRMKIAANAVFRNSGTQGRLIFLQPDEKTRFSFMIWFDYTRILMNDLREGDLLAVNNFATNNNEIHWSILEITNVLPIHYALGSRSEDLRGFPGYIMATAGNLSTDWMQQESVSSEDTTKIQCFAVPVNLEIVQQASSSGLELQEELNIPMVGSEVKLLSVDSTQEILNMNLNDITDIIKVGTLIRESKIDVFMDIQNAVKTHIGIFGFTGVGKSNFISTTISSLLSSGVRIKLLVFDLNNEYLGLLSDLLISNKVNSYVLNIGEKTLTGKVQEFIKNGSNADLDNVTSTYLRELYLTRGLNPYRKSFYDTMKSILSDGKLKVLRDEYQQTLGEFLESEKEKLYDEYVTIKITGYLDLLFNEIITGVGERYITHTLDSTLANSVYKQIQSSTKKLDSENETPGRSTEPPISTRINLLRQDLKKKISPQRWNIKSQHTVSYDDLIQELNDESQSSLIIINSFDPDEMRNFTYNLGTRLYENRRRSGKLSPLVSFVLDEADEFIPSNVIPGSSYSHSKRVIEMIARRGRKFGIGLTIATQRATYLDTNIMGQLHTYFVSKLPRETDREKVGEAFAVSQEMFTQTFKFRKGDWLYISHESAGLDSVPIPIRSEDAEQRIKSFLSIP